MCARFFVEECENENLTEWQNFVDSSSLGSIFQTKYWAKALQEAGSKMLLVVARDRKGNISGGILGTYSEYSLLKFNIIPGMLVWGGPLVYDVNDKQLLEMMLRTFDMKAKKLGALTSFIRSFAPLDEVLVNRLNYIMEYDSLPCTVIMDLTKSSEYIWKNMHDRARRGIRKAEKKGLVVEEGKCLDDLLAYYQICRPTAKRLKISLISFRVMESLWRNFSHRNNVKLFLAKYGSEPIAGVIIVRWQEKMWGWHGASLEQYWHLNPNLLIHWNIINWGINNGVKSYDIMGIPCKKDENHPKYGLYLFKTQFGGKIVRHGEYEKNFSPLKTLLLKRILAPLYVRFFA